MVKLKMVAGKTYMCPPIFGYERIITKGEEVEVEDEQGEMLLAESYTDALNNQHFYFAEIGSDAVPLDDDGKVPQKSRRVRHAKPA
jgi:hypothetical protein